MSDQAVRTARCAVGRQPIGWRLAVKRSADVALSAIALLLLSPLFFLLAALCLVLNGKPILYRWDVVGKDGRLFTGYKFRTMARDAHRQRPLLLDRNEMRGPVFKIRDDPRVTRLGRVLRRSSLDELPQLWSVLKGDMSLVGPRPVFPHEWEGFEAWHRRKLSVTPGITCFWQVRGRNRIVDFDEWIRLDLKYIDEWSLWLDVKILLATLPAVLSGRGAS